MNVEHLKYILEVERQGSISKAAESLYMTQPYLSKVIHDIEKELDTRIFERSNKGVVVTQKGRLAIKKIHNLVDQFEDLQHMSKGKHESPRYFSLASITSIYTSNAFFCFLKKSDMLHDSARIVYHETDTTETMNLVVSGQYDLGIIRLYDHEISFYRNIAKNKRLKFQVLREYTKVVLMSQNNPLAKKKSLYLADLKNQIEVLHNDIRYSDDRIAFLESFVEMAGIQRIIKVHDRMSIAITLSTFNNAFFWTSPPPREYLREHNLVTVACQDYELKGADILLYPEDHTLNSYEKLYLQCIEEELEQIDC
ncbi:MAG: LysR family transcriptional regulator [Erysipelotrichaceae bacterium]|nr:LysR family transcriptional regulator [Erysipelotrichaceae bacterium]